MWQYPIKITNIQVEITFIVPKLIDGVPSHAKGVEWLKWPGRFPTRKNSHVCVGKNTGVVKEGWEGRGPTEWRYDLARAQKLDVYLEFTKNALDILKGP
jgi:hypothetical protein